MVVVVAVAATHAVATPGLTRSITYGYFLCLYHLVQCRFTPRIERYNLLHIGTTSMQRAETNSRGVKYSYLPVVTGAEDDRNVGLSYLRRNGLSETWRSLLPTRLRMIPVEAPLAISETSVGQTVASCPTPV